MSSEASRGALRPHQALNLYVIAVASLAILLTLVDLARPPTDGADRSPVLFVGLLAATIVAEQLSFRVHRGWISAAATLPHITCALLFSPAQAELIGLVGALTFGLGRRESLPKLVFNAAVVGLAVGAAAHLALSLGGPGLVAGAAGW